MSTAAKERKRAADREAQRHNRARTKAYITYLEKTLQDLSGPSGQGQDTLGHQLAQQQEKINHLQETLRKIARLAQDAANPLSASFSTASDPAGPPTAPPQPTVEEPLPTRACNILPAATGFFGLDLICSDRERNYLAVLGSAVTLVQCCSPALSENPISSSGPTRDDDFCIRAVVDGWKVATARTEADVVWSLLQAIDEGLFYRTDPVTRIALLRIMRSMLLQRMGVAQEASSLPEYMFATPVQTSVPHQPFLDFFPWPQFRDTWIVKGMEYADENCAASFGARIRFEWPFELRDVYKRNVLTGTVSFSAEFESRYRDLGSWRLDSEGDWLRWSSEAYPCPVLPEELLSLSLSGDAHEYDGT
ncbi:hypothetical protein BO86DRAFT_392261 [Aspergillus japonicus CBS 114.51]|uniref:BZIP domain-containing protein n=1 Tax=Aspergillus japonicus CBS 114.51 TaxID=1448312 RepID=A0A8T8WPU7_ASPJA|nr:hypothetical protein BO86DRAFT_392261 [Aspergillus japonicus CBS 114.51]RAH77865.1 hypothetical protein BO86DRAFT_392261 [Aspergillus japonicus CBS 114.51]